MVRRFIIGLVHFILVVPLAACSQSATDVEEMKFNEVPAYIAEYQQATEGRTLPAGMEWPDEPPGEKSGRYQVGVGVSDADGIWRCAWTEEWLAARGEAGPRAEVALTELGRFPETHLYTVALDDVGKEWFDTGLRAAGLGDPTEFQRFADVNCG